MPSRLHSRNYQDQNRPVADQRNLLIRILRIPAPTAETDPDGSRNRIFGEAGRRLNILDCNDAHRLQLKAGASPEDLASAIEVFRSLLGPDRRQFMKAQSDVTVVQTRLAAALCSNKQWEEAKALVHTCLASADRNDNKTMGYLMHTLGQCEERATDSQLQTHKVGDVGNDDIDSRKLAYTRALEAYKKGFGYDKNQASNESYHRVALKLDPNLQYVVINGREGFVSISDDVAIPVEALPFIEQAGKTMFFSKKL